MGTNKWDRILADIEIGKKASAAPEFLLHSTLEISETDLGTILECSGDPSRFQVAVTNVIRNWNGYKEKANQTSLPGAAAINLGNIAKGSATSPWTFFAGYMPGPSGSAPKPVVEIKLRMETAMLGSPPEADAVAAKDAIRQQATTIANLKIHFGKLAQASVIADSAKYPCLSSFYLLLGSEL